MNVVFLIVMMNSFRHLAPLIEEGIKRKHSIECWHDYSVRRDGSKGYLFPDIEKAPFREPHNPGMKSIAFHTKTEMAKAIISHPNGAFFVSQYPIEFFLSPQHVNEFKNTWCTVMHVHDSFLELKRINPEDLQPGIKKLFFPYTAHYANLGLQYFDKFLPFGKKYFSEPETKLFPIGCPILDPKLLQLSKAAIRKKYSIPEGKNILLYLPFTFNFDAAKGHRQSIAWQAAFAGIHVKRKALKKFNSNTFKIDPFYKRISKRLSYFKKILTDTQACKWFINTWNEPAVINTIRTFCNRNNLHLVVKPRIKFDFSEEVYRKADLVVDDDESQYFPSKLQELFCICDLSIGYFTTAVLESVYCDVPHINLHYPDTLSYNPHRKFWYSAQQGSLFSFKGAVWDIHIPNFIKEFPKKEIAHYNMAPDKRYTYMQTYTGLEQPSTAEKFFSILEQEAIS